MASAHAHLEGSLSGSLEVSPGRAVWKKRGSKSSGSSGKRSSCHALSYVPA